MARASALKRLATLYARVEDLHAMQVKAAAAAVFEVDRAVEGLTAQRLESASEARAGLARGSRIEALAIENVALKDEARAGLLARAGVERRVQLEAALELYRESRIEARQIDQLVQTALAAEEAERARRAQAESDDRFLARRVWQRSVRQ